MLVVRGVMACMSLEEFGRRGKREVNTALSDNDGCWGSCCPRECFLIGAFLPVHRLIARNSFFSFKVVAYLLNIAGFIGMSEET